jgi:hypothetical protein
MTVLTRAVWIRVMPTSTMAAPMIWTRVQPSSSYSQATRKARITSNEAMSSAAVAPAGTNNSEPAQQPSTTNRGREASKVWKTVP